MVHQYIGMQRLFAFPVASIYAMSVCVCVWSRAREAAERAKSFAWIDIHATQLSF